MRTATKLVTVLGRADIYRNYVRSLQLALWFRLNEASGSANALNAGSLGAGLDAPYTNCTLSQVGKTGSVDAVSFNGTTSLITVPANAYINAAALTAAVLVKITNAGEGGAGTFFDCNSATYLRFNGGLTALRAGRASTGAALTTTSSGVSAGVWTWLFWTYDHAGDKKIHLYKGVTGAVTEYSYVAQTAATGTLTDLSAVTTILGNNAAAAQTTNGLIDEVLLAARVLSAAEMLRLVQSSGV